ncbi:MAG TPA: hypothetical protein VGL07_18215 [Buttiauxella sp.]
MSQNLNCTTQDTAPQTAVPMAFVRTTTADIWCHAQWLGGEWVTEWGQKTLSDLQDSYPDMAVMSVAALIDLQNDKYRTPVTEITRERYIDQLEVLPPMDWCRSNNGESFKSMEMYAGDVTSIFVRTEGRFFEFRDVCTLSHAQVLARVETEILSGSASFSGH